MLYVFIYSKHDPGMLGRVDFLRDVFGASCWEVEKAPNLETLQRYNVMFVHSTLYNADTFSLQAKGVGILTRNKRERLSFVPVLLLDKTDVPCILIFFSFFLNTLSFFPLDARLSNSQDQTPFDDFVTRAGERS
jgi:hypothetical protein